MAEAVAMLRAATQALHRAVESTALPTRMMSRDVDLDDYRAFLDAQYRLLAAWSRRGPTALRTVTSRDPALRLQALASDLATLGAPPDAGDEHRDAFDWPADSAAWWGALYVLEGSRLGARVIARHLRARLGPAAADALRFLDGDDAGALPWPQVIRVLEDALPPTRHALAVEGAVATFGWFLEAFSRDRTPARVDDDGCIRATALR